MVPPTKFDVVKGAFLLACGVIGVIALHTLIAVGACTYVAITTGELGRCTELKIGDYLNGALMAVISLVTIALNRPKE